MAKFHIIQVNTHIYNYKDLYFYKTVFYIKVKII